MKYLTIDNVCEMLNISRRTLERMRQRDPLQGAKSFKKSHGMTTRVMTNSNIANLESFLSEPLPFPEPDLYIGRSPRWEQEKLIKWLQENGARLQT